jgi:hypothetical protein
MRIEVEHGRHGGMENGQLPVTFDDFIEFGVDRHAVAPALREAEALGLIKCTQKGCAGNAGFRRASEYGLTYRPFKGAMGDGTHEWRNIKTIEEAKALAAKARAEHTERKQPRRRMKLNMAGAAFEPIAA